MDRKNMNELKVVLIGDTCSGKTTFVSRIFENKFETRFNPTLGVEIYPLRYKRAILTLWDTAGDDRYVGLKEGYYLNTDVFLVFCNSKTVENVKKWIKLARKTVPEAKIIVIYNKKRSNDVLELDLSKYKIFQIFEKNLKKDGRTSRILDAILT